MGANTKIEWADHTFNAWEGCTKVSPGCFHCYAEKRNARFGGGRAPNWGPGAPRRRTSAPNWRQPYQWNRQAEATSKIDPPLPRPRVFAFSLADWLDPEVPTQWRHDFLDVIAATPHLDWLLLTKRPEWWPKLMDECEAHGSIMAEMWRCGFAPSNVHLGITIEDNKRAIERRADFQRIPAEFKFVSYEPALEAVDWTGFEFIDQLICGGESGPGAQPMHPEWARGAREFCRQNDVSFFFKQWGDWLPLNQENGRNTNARGSEIHTFDDDSRAIRVGKICAGRLLDSAEHNEMPVPF